VDILDDMGVSKLSAKVFFKVNYSFNTSIMALMTSSEQVSEENDYRYTDKRFLFIITCTAELTIYD